MFNLVTFQQFVKQKSKLYPFCIILFIVILILIFYAVSKSNMITPDNYTILNKTENISYITAKGKIDSNNSTEIYSSVSNTFIKKVNVKQGDMIKKNAPIAYLDTTNMENEINQLESTINTLDITNQNNLSTAKKAYDTALSLNDENTNNEIINATSNLDAACLDLENKQYLFESYKALYDSDAISYKDFIQYKSDYENAKNNYTNALANLNSIKSSVSLNLTKAKNDYENAKAACNDNTKKLLLEQKKNDLNKSIITAPYDGVITEVNTSAGNPSTGCLFKIADINNLISTADVKENDIAKIKLGQPVDIDTNSNNSILHGTVIGIKQIPKKDDSQLKLNDDSNDDDSEYEVHIKINDSNHKLKLGMKTKVKIITEKKEGAFIVQSESIAKDEQNNKFVFIAIPSGYHYIVKKMPVTLGTQSDSSTEIINPNLCNGTIILNNPLSYKENQKIKLDLR